MRGKSNESNKSVGTLHDKMTSINILMTFFYDSNNDTETI